MDHKSLALLFLCSIASIHASSFSDDFFVNFGAVNTKYPEGYSGNMIQLGLDKRTGSGFRSKLPYLYGHLSMKIKLVGGNSAGTVTSYYMASTFKRWCELDFEFLGNVSGEPYILQTNVFSEGQGGREQRIFLWFDPTADYHDYGIIWNQGLIKFLVDGSVIRVFHNAKDLGVPYLDYQPMYIYSSIWNGDSWATRGGKVKIDWAHQPFTASYTSFDVQNACRAQSDQDSAQRECYKWLHHSSYGWPPNLELSQAQIDALRWIRKKNVIYDYCTDTKRFNNRVPPECARNWP